MAKKKFIVTLCYNVGYTATVEADDEDQAIDLAKEQAEIGIPAGDEDHIDYVDCDDSCTQTEEVED